MKSSHLLGACIAAALFVANVRGQGAYIERQLLCALDQAPCDAWGQEIKSALPEVIGRGCQSCDHRQINNIRRVTRFVQTRYPALWAALVDRYSNTDSESQQRQ